MKIQSRGPFFHAWVVTRYADVIHVFHDFSAPHFNLSNERDGRANLIAQVMVRQMLFLPPNHTRLRALHRLRSPCEEGNLRSLPRKTWTASVL